jgi:hypothetical protein
MSEQQIKITKRMLAGWFTANCRTEREDSLWEFLQRESSGHLQYQCPACKIPILVGKHSITIDRDRIESERMSEIECAAKNLLDNLGVDLHGGDRPIPVEAAVVNKLREAMSR